MERIAIYLGTGGEVRVGDGATVCSTGGTGWAGDGCSADGPWLQWASAKTTAPIVPAA